jgi:hypothetical protein
MRKCGRQNMHNSLPRYGASKNEGIYPLSSKFDLKFRCNIIHSFSSRDWCVFFCVLSNPVEDLLLTIFVKGDMLSSLSGLVQPVRESHLDTRSWTVECSHQRINGDWDIVAGFCNILHECNLLASKFKLSKIRFPCKNLQPWPEKQNSSRRGKILSRGSAGAAYVSPDLFWPSM